MIFEDYLIKPEKVEFSVSYYDLFEKITKSEAILVFFKGHTLSKK